MITAAELQAAGLIAGNINAISFNLSAVPSPNTPPTDYQISLGTTSNSTLSAWTTTGLTTVFGPATPPTITTGWNTITFSAPYAWDGVSNILVDIRGTELYGSANAVTYNTTTSGNTTLYAYTTTSNPSFWTSDPTPSTSTSRMNTRFNGQGVSVCASPRTAVVATIGAAPALSITPDTSICNNAVLALNVTSNLSDFDSYVWTPEADLYTDAACTTPYTVGANASTVYLKSTTAATTEYFCSALNSGTGCTNMDTVEVTVLPAAAVASASPDAICVSGSSVIDVTPNTGFGTATFQWMESTDNVTFSDVVGANATSYSTPVLTDTTYYKLVVEVGSTVCLESSVASVIVHNPSLLTAVTDSVCGDVPATLTATTDAGYDVYWFSDALGTNLLSTGSPFVTPDITAATTYYVAAGVDFAGGIAGAPNTGISASLTSQTSTTSGINFDVLATEATIHSVDIYPTAAIGSAFTIRVSQGGTTIATYSGLTTVSGSETTPVVMTVPVEFTLPAGTGYLMTLSVNPGVIRNSGGDAFPYTIPGYLTLTSSTLSGYYYYLYNWNATSGCLSALTPLTVEHTTAPAITVTASAGTICQGESTNVSASSSNAGYTYTWQAGALSGATQSVSPTTDSTFNVVATDNSGGANDGCIANGSVSIVVNPVPVSLSIDVSDNSICAGETIDLFADAVSGDLATDTIFAESFENAGTIPAGWVAALDVDGNATNAALTYPTTTSYPSGFNAYDGTYLVRFNSYSVGVGNSARLSNSTGFPTTGYDQVDVTFAMMRDDGYSTDNDNVALQYSTDGTTWYTLGTPFSRYSAAGDAWEVKSVTLPDSLENLSTLYIAFLFTSAYGNDVYIDYVNVKGYYPAPATYEWTSVPAGFTSTQQNPMGVAPTVTTQYTVAAFNSYGCSLTADTTVTVNPIPSVYLGADQDICDTTTITLDAGNPGSTFNWSTGGSAQTESILGADLGAGANVVSVTVTSAAGCIGYDEVTITVTVCDGIEDPTMHISYYPNPATDMLNLDLSELPAGDYRFEMFNMQGQKVMDRILVNEGNVILVNLLDVAPGSYVISVNGNNNSFRNYLTIQE
ncbi:hypothetical protein SDC9_64035 [bioreactor metagenome]|uniref:Ig-like domain-containing protein n=1 Tax=bioreactor metagenome TaxID=1076179 RepID=A0A644XPG7_9ZZZZ